MTSRKTSIIAFLVRTDRSLLLQAPLLWRTRSHYILTILTLTVMLFLALIPIKTQRLSELYGIDDSMSTYWNLAMMAVGLIILLWIASIVRVPVGELWPSRHVVTVVVVAFCSYLWLITPSFFAYRQIHEIATVGPNSTDLDSDSKTLSQYTEWACVSQDVFDNPQKMSELRDVLKRYTEREWAVDDLARRTEWSSPPRRCEKSTDRALNDWYNNVFTSRQIIGAIEDARSFESDTYNEYNIFSRFIVGQLTWIFTSIGIGVLSCLLSYPFYVWRRVLFSR